MSPLVSNRGNLSEGGVYWNRGLVNKTTLKRKCLLKSATYWKGAFTGIEDLLTKPRSKGSAY